MVHSPKKSERVERLMRALLVREGEQKVAVEVERRATIRRESLDHAVRDLRATIQRLVDEDIDDGFDETVLKAPDADGTIRQRIIAFVEDQGRAVSANEISQGIDERVEVVRSTLSKMFIAGEIARPVTGKYKAFISRDDAKMKGGK